MSHHTDTGPELSRSLVQVLDVLSHQRGGNGFPSLFNDQHLPVLLQTHLLQEDIHDNQSDYREELLVLFDGIDLEYDESLAKQGTVHTLVENLVVVAALVEGL